MSVPPKIGPRLKINVPSFKRTDFSGDIERLGGFSHGSQRSRSETQASSCKSSARTLNGSGAHSSDISCKPGMPVTTWHTVAPSFRHLLRHSIFRNNPLGGYKDSLDVFRVWGVSVVTARVSFQTARCPEPSFFVVPDKLSDSRRLLSTCSCVVCPALAPVFPGAR